MTYLTNESIKYRVLVDGKVLNESTNKILADAFLSSLTEEEKAKAKIVPVMEDGRQILFD